ncbi:MAG: polar amino acid transport system permease protein [Halobacteriales archaeon]|jgi:polar amino acid transport system permease protein
MDPILAGFDASVLGLTQLSDWVYILENWQYLLGGTVLTIALTLVSVVLGFLLGFPAGTIEVYGGRYLKPPVQILGVILRGTPILVIFMFTYFVVPLTEWFPIHLLIPGVGSAFVAAIVGLGLRSAAYQAQLFRGSIQSVSGGQMEAGRSVGLTKLQAIRHVVVPQALRRSIPGFQNEFTIVLKDTSIAIALGLAELLTRSYNLFQRAEYTDSALEALLFISAIYFVLTFATNRGLDYLGRVYHIPTGESS